MPSKPRIITETPTRTLAIVACGQRASAFLLIERIIDSREKDVVRVTRAELAKICEAVGLEVVSK